MKVQVLGFPHDVGISHKRHGYTRKGIVGPGVGLCGFWRIELDSGLVFATAGLFHIFELEPREGPANLIQLCERIHPEDLPRLLKAFENAGSARSEYSCSFRVRRSGGRYQLAQAMGTFQPVCGDAGAIIGMTFEAASERPHVGSRS